MAEKKKYIEETTDHLGMIDYGKSEVFSDKKEFKPDDLNNLDNHGQVLGNSFDTLTNQSYDIPQDGDYEIVFNGFFDSNPSTVTALNLYINGTGTTGNYKEIGIKNGPRSSDLDKKEMRIDDVQTLLSGDTVEIKGKVESGNNSEFKIGKLIIKKI